MSFSWFNVCTKVHFLSPPPPSGSVQVIRSQTPAQEDVEFKVTWVFPTVNLWSVKGNNKVPTGGLPTLHCCRWTSFNLRALGSSLFSHLQVGFIADHGLLSTHRRHLVLIQQKPQILQTHRQIIYNKIISVVITAVVSSMTDYFKVLYLEFLIIQQFSAFPLEEDCSGFLSQLLE